MRNEHKAANGVGPGAGKGARAEATERELERAHRVALFADAVTDATVSRLYRIELARTFKR